jgi:glycosyltransferase involved in cell wall biosynthesis
VIPTSGGIRLETFFPATSVVSERRRLEITDDKIVVINPRGIRPRYVRNDVFFAAMPSVLKRFPNTVFLAVGMQGHSIAERWVRDYGVEESVRLLPAVAHSEMGRLFQCADITVSPSIHDGTPNTLLEAMACGTFPVAGDIESVREWIRPGVNGLLCDPTDAHSLAGAICEAIASTALRDRARMDNLAMIASRAEYGKCMREAEELYQSLI